MSVYMPDHVKRNSGHRDHEGSNENDAPVLREGMEDFGTGRVTFASDKFVSFASDFLSRKRKGTIAQPRSSGTRQPHSFIFSGGSQELSATPMEAANITATCWLRIAN